MSRRDVTGGAIGQAQGWRHALRSIQVQIGLLIVALVLINGLAVGVLIVVGYRIQSQRTELQLTETATALSLAVDGKVRESAGVLNTLAMVPRLARGDLPGFDVLARRMVGSPGRWVVLVDDQGRHLVDTALPPGAALQTYPSTWFEDYRRVIGKEPFYVTDLAPSKVTGLKVGVIMPVPQANHPVWHLGIMLAPSVLQQVFDGQAMPPGWYGSLNDRQGTVIARSLHSARYVGRPGAPDVLAHALHRNIGTFEGRSLEGYPVLVAYKRSALTGWTLTVSMPRSSAKAALFRFLALTTALTLGLLLIGVALVWWVGGRIARAIGGLAQAAKALGQGTPITPAPTGLSEIDAVGAALQESSIALKQREDELREHEARIRRLVEANIIGIVLWTVEGRVIEANDAFFDLVGYRREDLLSGRVLWPDMTAPEWRGADLRALEEVRAKGVAQPFEKEFIRKDGGRVPVLVGAATFSEAPEEGVAFVLDLRRQKQAEARLKLMVDELNHRVKNTLATVIAISAQTRRTATSPDSFHRAFQGRLAALSKTHNLLNQTFWTGVDLRDLVEQTLAPYATDERVVITGDNVRLGPVAAVTLGMGLYELTDNAAQYGALSTPSGQVRVSWRHSAPGRLRLYWEELGGPPVQPPSRRGFGLQLTEKVLTAELHGEVRLEFPPEGVRCTMDMALEPVSKH